jgi:DNA-binding NtrC family response regulator
MAEILLADDEAKLGKVVGELLELDGHKVTQARNGEEALRLLSARRFELVLTDLRMPGADGLQVLQAAKARTPPAEVILMTAYASAESAVAAMKAGAADYLIKPFSMDELRIRVNRLIGARTAETKSQKLLERLTPALVAQSAAMAKVLQVARQVAKSDASVLLLGESGTGKSQLARVIHYESARAAFPLSEVHCAALPETLLESELFGHEKGAFTGAAAKREGHLAAADQGTLFLDEIGEISQATQVKLLRFLQEREFTPVGSTETHKVDVRVITATNRNLAEAVKAGSFREDFYYRLNVITIEVPPLRARKDDVIPLAERHLEGLGVPRTKLSEATRQRILAYDWPGNVRELENAMSRAAILAGEAMIEPEHLGLGDRPSRTPKLAELLGPGFDLDAFERDLILTAIDHAGGNKTQAAKLLGITRRRLYSRLESLGQKLDDPPAA